MPDPLNREPLSAEELLAFLRERYPDLTLDQVIAEAKAHGFDLTTQAPILPCQGKA
jgi:hypothetical protein